MPSPAPRFETLLVISSKVKGINALLAAVRKETLALQYNYDTSTIPSLLLQVSGFNGLCWHSCSPDWRENDVAVPQHLLPHDG